jgi:hypothetical protein
MTTTVLYALKSKLNGNYFVFEQYCEDGYGAYEATLDARDLKGGMTPALFQEDVYTFEDGQMVGIKFPDLPDLKKFLVLDLVDHKNEDIQIVRVVSTFED